MRCSPGRIRQLIGSIRAGDESAIPTLHGCLQSELHWAAVNVGYSPVDHIETELWDQLLWAILHLPTNQKGEGEHGDFIGSPTGY